MPITVQKFLSDQQKTQNEKSYLKVVKTASGWKTSFNKITGSKSEFSPSFDASKKNRHPNIYVPGLRIMGQAGDVRNYLGELFAAADYVPSGVEGQIIDFVTDGGAFTAENIKNEGENAIYMLVPHGDKFGLEQHPVVLADQYRAEMSDSSAPRHQKSPSSSSSAAHDAEVLSKVSRIAASEEKMTKKLPSKVAATLAKKAAAPRVRATPAPRVGKLSAAELNNKAVQAGKQLNVSNYTANRTKSVAVSTDKVSKNAIFFPEPVKAAFFMRTRDGHAPEGAILYAIDVYGLSRADILTWIKDLVASSPLQPRVNASPAKTSPSKKAAAKKASPAKKAPAAKKASPAKKAPAAKKASPAKKAPAAKKASPAKKAPAAKKASPAKKAPAAKKPSPPKAPAAKKPSPPKAPAAKKGAAKKTPLPPAVTSVASPYKTLPPLPPPSPSRTGSPSRPMSPAHMSPARASPAHAFPAHASPAHASPAHASPAHASPARPVSPPRVSPAARVSPVKASPVQKIPSPPARVSPVPSPVRASPSPTPVTHSLPPLPKKKANKKKHPYN